jgi:ABC-type multidrug transport system ATPase subunit
MVILQDIRKTYPDGKEVLRGVSLTLASGMLGLLGPNGAGKTTLLGILTLAVEPTSGRRTYGLLDADRALDRAAIRDSIGYLPQDFRPVGDLSGREYLAFCARLRQVRLSKRTLAERIAHLLEAVDLTAVADRRCGDYSGGMRRRLGIAQALVHSPQFVVVDEPTAGLDAEERIRFRNLIAEAASSVTVLLSTHICEDIEATSDRMVVLAGGRVTFDGAPSELIARRPGARSLEDAYGALLASEEDVVRV